MGGWTDGRMRSTVPDLWDGGEGLVANTGWPRALLLALSLFPLYSQLWAMKGVEGAWKGVSGSVAACPGLWPRVSGGRTGYLRRLSHLGETLVTYLTSDITRPGQP